MAADGAHVAAAPAPDEARAAPAVPRHPLARRLTGWLFWFVIVAVLAWAWTPAEMYRAADLIHDCRNMAKFGSAFLRLNLHDWDSYLADMLVTLETAAWGTALAVLFGVPFSILSAANVCPAWVEQPVRRLMDACRAINEIVFALMGVVAVGPGPFTAVTALACPTLRVILHASPT